MLYMLIEWEYHAVLDEGLKRLQLCVERLTRAKCFEADPGKNPGGGYALVMAQSSERLEQLVRELAQLDSVDQLRVVARAARLSMRTEGATKLTIPILRGGGKWIGGDLGREAIYSDDGRCRVGTVPRHQPEHRGNGRRASSSPSCSVLH